MPFPWRRLVTCILCIGDSVTAGNVAGDGLSYPEVLWEMLRGRTEVINAGAGGTSVLDWVRPPVLWLGDDGWQELPAAIGGAFEQLAAEHLPCPLAIIELGGNDARGYFEVKPTSVDDFRNAMTELVRRLRANGVPRILILTPFPNPNGNEAVQHQLLAYRLALLNTPWPDGISVIDIYGRLDPEDHFEGNNPHPNAEGHWIIAAAVAERILGRGRWRRWR